MRPARAVLLDALGTLLALEPPAPLLQRALAQRGIEVDVAAAERAMAAEIAYYRAHLMEGADAAGLAALRMRCAEVMAERLGPPAGELDSATAQEVLLAALRFRAFPDAAPALRELRGAGVRLVVVSNWDCSLRERLGEVGLADLVDGAVSSAEARAAKPARAIFERALAIAGVPPAAAVHVGDSVREDVEGARGAGIEPVLVRREASGDAPPGVRTIRSLAELPAVRARAHAS